MNPDTVDCASSRVGRKENKKRIADALILTDSVTGVFVYWNCFVCLFHGMRERWTFFSCPV